MQDSNTQAEFAHAVRDSSPPSDRAAGVRPIDRAGQVAIHPILAAMFPILSLYVTNMDEIGASSVFRPLALSVCLAFIVWLVFFAVTRNMRRSALSCSACMLLFFSYGHIVNLTPKNAGWIVGPACVIVLAALITASIRLRSTLATVTMLANAAAVALVLPPIWSAAAHAITTAHSRNNVARVIRPITEDGQIDDVRLAPSAVAPAKSGSDTGPKPDIYYIILDAYGRSDSLKTFLGIDNEPFVAALRERGFYVADKSRSNYAQTGYCLPAYLNMEYLDALVPEVSALEYSIETQRSLIDKNAVAAFLRSKGYAYIDIWTGTAVSRVDTADLVLANNEVPPTVSLDEEAIRLSAAGAFLPHIDLVFGKGAQYDRHRAFLLTAFHNLAAVPHIAGPKFVFAHILAPHPPFVFGPNGEPTNPSYHYNEADASQLLEMPGYTREKYRAGYGAQVHYVNKRILEAVDAILNQSSTRPIIIIQGDHGSRMNVDWTSITNTKLDEPFSILNAYYVPDAVRKRLYSDITPVNSFRILLSTEFGANYPILPDRCLFATASKPMVFTDVTDRLSQAHAPGVSSSHAQPASSTGAYSSR